MFRRQFRVLHILILFYSLVNFSCIPEFRPFSQSEFIEKLNSKEIEWDDVLNQAKYDEELNLYYFFHNYDIEDWGNRLKNHFRTRKIKINLFPLEEDDQLFSLLQEEQLRGLVNPGEGILDILIVDRTVLLELLEDKIQWVNFVSYLPNAKTNIDFSQALDFGDISNWVGAIDINSNVLPLFKNFLVFTLQSDFEINTNLDTFQDFLNLLEQNSGVFTYSNPVYSSEGLYFIKSILLEENNNKNILHEDIFNLEDVQIIDALKSTFEYLNSIENYLYKKDNINYYPNSNEEINELFLEHKLNIKLNIRSRSEDLNSPYRSQEWKTWIFPSQGILYEKNYLLMPKNATHIAAALVFMNDMISIPLQLDQENFLGKSPVLSKQVLEDYKSKSAHYEPTIISTDKILKDVHVSWDRIIEKIWEEYIYKKSSKDFNKIASQAIYWHKVKVTDKR